MTTTPGTIVKLGLFITAAVISSVLVVNTLTAPLEGSTRSYHAVFSDVQGLRAGSHVMIAGVRVGTVTGLSLRDGVAAVDFEVTDDQRIPARATAAIRYADLLGARYVALGTGDGAGELPEDGTIPIERTQPAVDLTALFNGFKPLFEVIEPTQVNQLAGELLAVFEGQTGTVDTLLTRVISVTSSLSAHDEVIWRLVGNLNAVMSTMTNRKQELHLLVDRLGELASGVAANRQVISDALDSGGQLADTLAQQVARLMPTLNDGIGTLQLLTASLVRNQDAVNTALRSLPTLLTKVNGTTDYGSWVNIYVCNLNVLIPGAQVNLDFPPHSPVCR
jgi:phospholipid/cholesterol/gamma-HCH transport system substrate-binding protein